MTKKSDNAQNFWLETLGDANNFNRWIFGIFEPWLDGEILELGCGTGNFTALMARNGWRVTGIDIDSDYVQTAKRRLSPWRNASVHVKDITRMEDGPLYDTVILLDVLEHIENDVELLRSIARRLRPGGGLVLKVPALPTLYSPMDTAIGHFRRYDLATLETRLVEAGFESAVTRPVNALGIVGWWLNGKVLRKETPPAAQVSAFNRIIPLAGRVEQSLRLPIGLSLMSLSRRTAA